jgi:hypothetical protein
MNGGEFPLFFILRVDRDLKPAVDTTSDGWLSVHGGIRKQHDFVRDPFGPAAPCADPDTSFSEKFRHKKETGNRLISS